jgi:hypothetical protein
MQTLLARIAFVESIRFIQLRTMKLPLFFLLILPALCLGRLQDRARESLLRLNYSDGCDEHAQINPTEVSERKKQNSDPREGLGKRDDTDHGEADSKFADARIGRLLYNYKNIDHSASSRSYDDNDDDRHDHGSTRSVQSHHKQSDHARHHPHALNNQEQINEEEGHVHDEHPNKHSHHHSHYGENYHKQLDHTRHHPHVLKDQEQIKEEEGHVHDKRPDKHSDHHSDGDKKASSSHASKKHHANKEQGTKEEEDLNKGKEKDDKHATKKHHADTGQGIKEEEDRNKEKDKDDEKMQHSHHHPSGDEKSPSGHVAEKHHAAKKHHADKAEGTKEEDPKKENEKDKEEMDQSQHHSHGNKKAPSSHAEEEIEEAEFEDLYDEYKNRRGKHSKLHHPRRFKKGKKPSSSSDGKCRNMPHSYIKEWTGEECENDDFLCFEEGLFHNCCKCRPECCGKCEHRGAPWDSYQACPNGLPLVPTSGNLPDDVFAPVVFIVIGMIGSLSSLLLTCRQRQYNVGRDKHIPPIRRIRSRSAGAVLDVRYKDRVPHSRREKTLSPIWRYNRNEIETYFDKIAMNDPSITEVNLSGNHKFINLNKYETIKAAKAFARNTHVKAINMSCCEIGDEFAEAIGKSLESNEAIEELWLENNVISRNGIKFIFEGVAKNSCLSELRLHGQFKSVAVSDETDKFLSDEADELAPDEAGDLVQDVAEERVPDEADELAEIIERNYSLFKN